MDSSVIEIDLKREKVFIHDPLDNDLLEIAQGLAFKAEFFSFIRDAIKNPARDQIKKALYCKYCKEKFKSAEDRVPTRSYWHGNKYGKLYAHKACKDNGEKSEAYECQVIDADCNDCKHFKRWGKIKDSDIWEGQCLKFDKPTNAYPNFATGHTCFEHRKEKAMG